MRLETTAIEGAWFVELAPQRDERGEFARAWCREVFREEGIDFEPVQCNISRNPVRGTLRGLHFQRPPHGEPKLVQCVRGRIYDVAVDLRRSSQTFGTAVGTELCSSGNRLFLIPSGCAHGFLTLEPNSDVFYYMGAPFVTGSAAGVRWDDPSFRIDWPEEPSLVSSRDASFALFDRARDAWP